MLAKARVKYMRISPRKTRLVLDTVRGKTVERAHAILDSTNKRAGGVVKKVVNSAFANLNSNRPDKDKFLAKDVLISEIKADNGPVLKRYRAATMGRATPVRHRTAHISVGLDKVPAERPEAGQAGQGSKAKAETESK
ncbi:MAG: 50S ribosomal protein L22 [Candidatus Omnitrophica bacterium]|nr:50S ribosomal protein L22 [Candidatus Omnitrophota bacterium]